MYRLWATLALGGLLGIASCSTPLPPPPKKVNLAVPMQCQTVIPPLATQTPADTIAPSDSTSMVAKKWAATAYYWMGDDIAIRIQIGPCLKALKKLPQAETVPQPSQTHPHL